MGRDASRCAGPGHHKVRSLCSSNQPLCLDSPLSAPATYDDACERVGDRPRPRPRRPAATQSARMCSGSFRRSRRVTISSITSSASTSTRPGAGSAIAALGLGARAHRHLSSTSAPARSTSPAQLSRCSRLCGPGHRRRLRRTDAARRRRKEPVVGRDAGRRRRARPSASPDDSASGAIVAFGIRNVADLDAGLREVHRVLAPGARFVILEFTTPRSRDRSRAVSSLLSSRAASHRCARERPSHGIRVPPAIGRQLPDRRRPGRANAWRGLHRRAVAAPHPRHRGHPPRHQGLSRPPSPPREHRYPHRLRRAARAGWRARAHFAAGFARTSSCARSPTAS